MKGIYPYLREVIELIGEISKKGDIEYIESIMYYIIERADTEEVDGIFSEIKEAVTNEYKGVVMTIAERLEQRGIEKGREAGIQIGIEKGIEKVARSMLVKKLDEKIIAESTGLSEAEVEKLKN